MKVKAGDVEFDARVRIDTPGEANYYRNGGIMQYVLRSLRGYRRLMDLGLGGRGYLLTGASRGLGFATARALVDDGARVLISSRTADSVDAAVAALGGAPAALGVAADLADPDAAERLVAEARERLGRVDGALITVGGPAPGHGARDRARSDWRAGGRERAARPAAAGQGAGPAPATTAPRSASCSPPRCASRSATWPSPTGCAPGWR